MKTFKITPSNINKKWVIVDAKDQALGRIASEVAYILRGKNKATYVPHLDCGDNVILINAGKVKLTGQKWEKKTYYHHTGYVGGIKSITAKELFAKKPEDLVQRAVKGMLPKNKLSRAVIKNLRIYLDENHKHTQQKPEAAQPRLVNGEK